MPSFSSRSEEDPSLSHFWIVFDDEVQAPQRFEERDLQLAIYLIQLADDGTSR